MDAAAFAAVLEARIGEWIASERSRKPGEKHERRNPCRARMRGFPFVPRAHTNGDAIVHFVKSDVIHMGDTYFNGMYPFIDTSSGGTVDGVIAACDLALGVATGKTRIIPGRGPLSGKADSRTSPLRMRSR